MTNLEVTGGLAIGRGGEPACRFTCRRHGRQVNNELLTQIKSIILKSGKFRKLVFVVIKVLGQIVIGAKEQQIPVLTGLTMETEKKILGIS